MAKKALHIAPVRGTRDLWYDELRKQQYVISMLSSTAKRYGFAAIQTPTIEASDLFRKSLGAGSDIVMKVTLHATILQ
jgi:histidyl-tRNA synthetase